MALRRFLVAGRLHGSEAALKKLEDALNARQPDALLFVGGVLDPTPRPADRRRAAERLHDDFVFLERFFEALGRTGVYAAVIPGPEDAPLREFLKVGLNAEVDFPNVHLAHATLLEDGETALEGIGGELTHHEDSGDHVVRVSKGLAEYFLRGLWRSEKPLKVLLVAVPPTGKLGGEEGNPIVTEFIDSYAPTLCAASGESERRGWDRVAHTLIVNPGRLISGSAAWVDLTQPHGQQVELLDL